MSVFKRTIIVWLLLPIILFSCLKEDYSNISGDYIWNPILSVPFFEQDVNTENYVGDNDFIYDYINIGEVTLGDTIDFDVNDLYSDDHILQIMLRFELKNGFPSELNIDASYLDAAYNIIEPIFDSPLICDKPEVDTDGNVENPTQILHDEYINQESLDIINQAKHIVLFIKLSNVDNSEEVVNQLDSYNIDANMGVRAYINYPIND